MIGWLLRIWRDQIVPLVWWTTPAPISKVIPTHGPTAGTRIVRCPVARPDTIENGFGRGTSSTYLPPHMRDGNGNRLVMTWSPSTHVIDDYQRAQFVNHYQQNTVQFIRLLIDVARGPSYHSHRDRYTSAYHSGRMPNHNFLRVLATRARQQYRGPLYGSPQQVQLTKHLDQAIVRREAVQTFHRAQGSSDAGHEAFLNLLIEVKGMLCR